MTLAMTLARTSIISLIIVVASSGVAACGATNSGRGSTAAPGAAGSDLSGVCPATVVFQTGWFPDSTQSAVYNLLGDDYVIDDTRKATAGTLVDGGRSTGIRAEIRSGGPAIGFAPVAQQMYVDKSILFGDVSTDDAIVAAREHPVVAVVAPLDISPAAIMWDPSSHPEWKTIADIGKSHTTVLYHKGSATAGYLVGAGLLNKAQVDDSFDGSPARFVSSEGQLAFEGYSTNEPYLYERVYKQWGRPLKYQLVHDTGYAVYPSNTLNVRTEDLTSKGDCLRRLVPAIQRSIAETVANPARAERIVVDAVAKENVGYLYPPDQAAYCSAAMKGQHLVGDGPDKIVGNFDTTRVARIIDILRPILDAGNAPVAADLTPMSVATNQFIDQSISAG